jgi:hypothetical protein
LGERVSRGGAFGATKEGHVVLEVVKDHRRDGKRRAEIGREVEASTYGKIIVTGRK